MGSELFTPEDVREILRAACEKAGGQKAWADKHDVSSAYVCDVLQGRREPGHMILRGLRMRRLVRYGDMPVQK